MSNYVVYHLPGTDHSVYMSSQSQPVILDSVADLNDREGFVTQVSEVRIINNLLYCDFFVEVYKPVHLISLVDNFVHDSVIKSELFICSLNDTHDQSPCFLRNGEFADIIGSSPEQSSDRFIVREPSGKREKIVL